MTDEQRQLIKTLRYQGLGYKQIANTIGLSRDSGRGYCISNGLHGSATGLVKQYHKVMEEELIFILCPNCGSEIKQNTTVPREKYRSLDCKREWDKIHRKKDTFVCEYCGKEFNSLGAFP